jgi:Mg2+/Co2+ transporter CorB
LGLLGAAYYSMSMSAISTNRRLSVIIYLAIIPLIRIPVGNLGLILAKTDIIVVVLVIATVIPKLIGLLKYP